MAPKLHFLCFLMIFAVITLTPNLSIAGKITPTELIDQVCRNTPNYDYCVSTIYGDESAKFFNRNDLADFIFRLVYAKTEIVQAYLKAQINKGQQRGAAVLKQCRGDYAVVDHMVSQGLSDMNTDEYQNLKEYSAQMAKSVLHCNAALHGQFPALANFNRISQGVIDICTSVSSLFSGGGD